MDSIENDLRGVVKALDDVVLPALDPADPLAGEQLRLAINYLDFLRTRLDFAALRRRFELRDNLAMAVALRAVGGTPVEAVGEALDAAVADGEHMLATPMDDAQAAREAAARLAAAIRIVVREASYADNEARDRIEQTVIGNFGDRIMFERAWYLPVGGDRRTSDVPSLQEIRERISSEE